MHDIATILGVEAFAAGLKAHYRQLLIVEDVNILQLKSARGEPTKLDQFGSVEGVSFQKRLKRTANRSQDDPLAQFLSTVGCIV